MWPALGEALGAHRSDGQVRMTWVMMELHGHGPSGCQTFCPVAFSPANARSAKSVEVGCVTRINQALAALNAALGRLAARPKWRRSQARCRHARLQASWLGRAAMKTTEQPWQRTYMSVRQSEIGLVRASW